MSIISPDSGNGNLRKSLYLWVNSSSDFVFKIVVINLGNETFEITKGMKIAQMLIQPVVSAEIEESDSLSETVRGDQGFGSTGH